MSGHTHGQWVKNNIYIYIKVNNCDCETTPLYWEKNKLTVTGWLEVTMRTKNLKMNGMALMKWILRIVKITYYNKAYWINGIQNNQ